MEEGGVQCLTLSPRQRESGSDPGRWHVSAQAVRRMETDMAPLIGNDWIGCDICLIRSHLLEMSTFTTKGRKTICPDCMDHLPSYVRDHLTGGKDSEEAEAWMRAQRDKFDIMWLEKGNEEVHYTAINDIRSSWAGEDERKAAEDARKAAEGERAEHEDILSRVLLRALQYLDEQGAASAYLSDSEAEALESLVKDALRTLQTLFSRISRNAGKDFLDAIVELAGSSAGKKFLAQRQIAES